jgi:hypothetical protein
VKHDEGNAAHDRQGHRMSILFACAGCGEQYTVGDELAGTKGRCQRCGSSYDVPYHSAATAAASKAPSVYGLVVDQPLTRQGIEPAEKPPHAAREPGTRAKKARAKYSTPDDDEASQEKSRQWRGFVIIQCLFFLALLLSWLRDDWDGIWYLLPAWLVLTLMAWASRRRSPSTYGLFSVGLGLVACAIGAGCGAFLYWALSDIGPESSGAIPMFIMIWGAMASVALIFAFGGYALGRQALAVSREKRHTSKSALTLAVLGLFLNGFAVISPLAVPLALWLLL